MKFLRISILALCLCSCGKSKFPNCKSVYEIDSFFTFDMKFISPVDTSWRDPKICGHNLDSFYEKPRILKLCDNGEYESVSYVLIPTKP